MRILPKGGDSLDLQLDEDTPELDLDLLTRRQLEPVCSEFQQSDDVVSAICSPALHDRSHLHLPLMNLVDTVDGECRHLIPLHP